MNRRLVVIGAAGLSVLAVALLLAAPWVSRRWGGLGGAVYTLGSLICHQRPERSFHLAGVQLPVCARCLGLYVAGAAGLVAWAARPSRATAWRRPVVLASLIVSAIPTAVTVFSAWLGLGDVSNAWRAASAVPLGLMAGLAAGASATDDLE